MSQLELIYKLSKTEVKGYVLIFKFLGTWTI